MPYFHGTLRGELASIQAHGLGGIDTGPNAYPCERGVYLARDPQVCVAMLLDLLLTAGRDDLRPSDVVRSWVVLVIDDARVDHRKLEPDPHVENPELECFLYRGIIDVRNAVVLDLDDLIRAAKTEAIS